MPFMERFMTDYNSLSDEQLVCDVDNRSRAVNEIVLRYSEIVRIKAASYTNKFVEFDDLYQEGMLGLLSAVAHYKNDKNTSFKTYANRCIENRMINTVKKANKIPIVKSAEEDILSSLGSNAKSPEDLLASKENLRDIFSKINKMLSSFEAEIFDSFLHGYTYEQIAKRHGITLKAVDNALNRARRKLKSIF